MARSTDVLTARVEAEPEAVYGWWTDPARLTELRTQWATMQDFHWTESRDEGGVGVKASWTTSSGIQVSLAMTIHRLGFPRTRSEIKQDRRHPDGRVDESATATEVEFRPISPAATEVRLTTTSKQTGRRWWENLPSARRRRLAHRQRHLMAQAAKCQIALTGVAPAHKPAPAVSDWW